MQVDTVHRITGVHLLLNGTGVAIWLRWDPQDDPEACIQRLLARIALALPEAQIPDDAWAPPIPTVYRFTQGAAVAIPLPPDLLYTGCAVLEWAETTEPASGELWDAITSERAEECRPRLRVCHAWAAHHGIPSFDDEDGFSLGLGLHSKSWTLDELPTDHELAAAECGSIPVITITGTNGKTTTTRMLAHIAKAAGLMVGNTSSDGVVVNGDVVEEGDWTGPGAARMVLRHPEVQIAVLETARGGLMRRGLVLPQVDAAVVTNISADHLGDWGLFDVDSLADAKLTVAKGLKPHAPLIVNRDCAVLRAGVERLLALRSDIPIRWFSAYATDQPDLTGWCQDDALWLRGQDGTARRLMGAADAPLTLGGAAVHNIENALAAAMAAQAAGIPDAAIVEGLSGLRADDAHSGGRSILYQLNGIDILFDFAHNPGGIRMMAKLAERWTPGRRFLVMGQAGDRGPALIRELAESAVSIGLDGVVVKELPGHSYDRKPEDIVQDLIDCLVHAGQNPDSIYSVANEVAAAHKAIDLAAPGDLVLLIVHEDRAGVMAALHELGATLG